MAKTPSTRLHLILLALCIALSGAAHADETVETEQSSDEGPASKSARPVDNLKCTPPFEQIQGAPLLRAQADRASHEAHVEQVEAGDHLDGEPQDGPGDEGAQPPPHPIFAPTGPGLPPVAHMDSPVAPTGAAFSEGLGDEPNRFRILPNGKGDLVAALDYNPLKSQQVPLVNGMVLANQGLAPAGSVAEQPTCNEPVVGVAEQAVGQEIQASSFR